MPNRPRLGLIRLDVLIPPQYILRVVLFFDLDEARIVRPVRRAHQLVTGIAQLVDVHSVRKGLQIVARSLNPFDYTGLLSRRTPHARQVHLVTRLPQSERRFTYTHTANRPTQSDGSRGSSVSLRSPVSAVDVIAGLGTG